MAKDYVYSITPLIEDALVSNVLKPYKNGGYELIRSRVKTDRDQVHRQTAASVCKHVALGVVGLGCEDAMVHCLNLLLPNIFETSPHVIDRVIEAIDAIRVAIGTGQTMNYVWAGLFHPARRVRQPYWRLYNDAYTQNADNMVPYFPNMSVDEGYMNRHELAIVL